MGPIRYPEAVFDAEKQRWISDAEVAETGSPPGSSSAGSAASGGVPGQAELFPGYRRHAVFTDSPLPLFDAEVCHRRHAIIEGVIADLNAGPPRLCRPGRFTANAASLALAAIAFILTRVARFLDPDRACGDRPIIGGRRWDR